MQRVEAGEGEEKPDARRGRAKPGVIRAIRRWLSRRLQTTLFVLTALLAIAAGLASVLIFNRQAALEGMLRYNLGWPAAQAGLEVARLQGSIGELAVRQGPAEREAVETWFGVVEARLTALRNGEPASLIRASPEFAGIVDRLAAAIETSRPLLQRLDDPDALARLMAEFTPLNRPLGRLSAIARAHAADLTERDARTLDQFQWFFSSLLVALVALSLALAAIAFRRNRLLVRSNADVRVLVLDLTRTGERLTAANQRVQEAVAALTEQNTTLQARDAEMLRQNRLFEAALHNMSQGLGMFDNDHRLIVSNRRFAEMFGLPRGLAVPGAPAADLFAAAAQVHDNGGGRGNGNGEGPDNGGGFGRRVTESTWAEHRRLAAKSRAGTFLRTDDDGRSLAVSHQPLGDGGWIATYEDVTGRLRHQKKLEQQAALLDLVRDAIIVRGMDGAIIYANQSAAHLHGWSCPEYTEMGSKDLVQHIYVDPSRFEEAFREVLAKGRWNGRFTQRRKDGSEVVVEASWSVMDQGPEGANAILSVHTDITERLALEERLRQSQRLEAVGQLTGGVAHDFNNLLTVILGSSETLVAALPEDDALRGLAEMTLTAAERGAALTNRLLAFSRRQTLEPRVVDVGAVLGGLATMLERTLGAHIGLRLASPPGLWRALIDQSQLENAVLNLCINARDAMPAGGVLTVASSNLELDDRSAPAVGEVTPGRYVVVTVSDTGTGMAPHVLTRAFEPFFTTKEVGQGSGLGLSMVYGFMKQSGGHVELASTRGVGTTVRMLLKAADSPEPPAIAPPRREAGGKERVLLVEDDAMVRAHAAAMLRGLGYAVALAVNAAEALDLLRADGGFDLLFSDVVMPGEMNGLKLALEARRMRPGIGLLLTSGYTENALQQHGALEPGTLLLSKPYRRHELASKIRAALEAAPARR